MRRNVCSRLFTGPRPSETHGSVLPFSFEPTPEHGPSDCAGRWDNTASPHQGSSDRHGLSLLKISRAPTWKDGLASRNAAQSEIRLAPERSKDVSDVVRRLDASLERRVPVIQDALDDQDSRVVDVVDSDDKAVLVHESEVLKRRDTRRLPVKVGA